MSAARETTRVALEVEDQRDRAGRSGVAALLGRAGRASGRPLDPDVRAYMEPRLGHDFGRVRVHTDARAAAAARSVRADAFTIGQDIWFAAGRYHGGTVGGRRLIAHELAHTLQQRAPASTPVVQLYREGTTADDSLEREADAAARRVAVGGSLAPGEVSVGVPGARLEVARQASERAMEEVEPPAVVDALAEGIRAALVDDPADRTLRVSGQLRRLGARTRAAVVARLRARLPHALAARVAAILEAPAPPGAERPAPGAPVTPPAPAAAPGVDVPGPEAVVAPSAGAVSAVAAAAAARPAAEPGPEQPVPAAEVRPAEPQSTAEAEAREAAHPPDSLAAAAAAGMTAPEAAPPESEPAAEPMAAEPPAPARDGKPAGLPSGGDESSESADTVDPRVHEAAAAGPEDAEEQAAATEAASPAASPRAQPAVETRTPPDAEPAAAEAPHPQASPATPEPGQPASAVAPAPESAAEPQAASPASGEPDVVPADAESGAGVPAAGEAQEVAAETALTATEPPGAEPGPAGSATEASAGEVEPGPEEQPPAPAVEPAGGGAEGGAGLEPDSPEQPAAAGDPAAEPQTAAVELGPLAEVDPDAGGDDADGGGGGGAGGGGAPIEAPPPAQTPDVAAAPPEAALDMIAALPPTAASAALGGVKAAASRSVGEQRAGLAAAPPQLERPSGAPTAAEAAAEAAAAGPPAAGRTKVDRTPAGPAIPVPAPAPLPPAPAPPTAAVRDPHLGGPSAQMTEADVAALRGSVQALPTTDPALSTTAGAPPALTLQGDADPARTGEQRAALDKATGEARAEGAADAAAPMGEAAVLPTVAPETLRAQISAASAPPVAGAPAAPTRVAGPDPAVDAVIAERRPGALQAGAATARGQMAAERQKQSTATDAAQAESRAGIEKEVAANAAKQRDQREDARSTVRGQRKDWTKEQQGLVDSSRKDADKAGAKAATDVATERQTGTTAAARHIGTGDRDITGARERAEREATAERRKGEQEPSGFLGWVASKAKAFFDGIKAAITKAFETARAAVRKAIETAQRLAAAAIDLARKAVVAAIKAAGDALIAIGDKVLAGFPGLRNKFRAAIKKAVDGAVKAVNALADALKKGVQALLDLYGKLLDGILGLLQAGLLAVVDSYAAIVNGAIKAAQAALDALGDLLEVAKDVAAGPVAWLRNLGAAIVDGIRNHLWSALKKAVKDWFDAKLDAVLGLGRFVWNILTKGGITLAAVGKMAFAALKKAIPVALIKLLIEKLVGLLVPAAAAVMAIIEGLQAAWGTVSQILGAISKFIAFLKAVKGGKAGPQFAAVVAAAAVVVIDFVSNWLLRRLLKPAAAVGKAIKAIAGKIAAVLGRLVKVLKRGIRKLTKRVKKWMRKMGRRFKKLKERVFGKRSRKDRRKRQEDRLDRAVAAIRPPLESMLRKGTSRLLLWGRLRWWQLRWWLSSLAASASGEITARINPSRLLARSRKVQLGAELEQILIQAEAEYFRELGARSPRLAEAETALKLGRTDLPEMTRAEQVLLLRRMQAGETPAWALLRPPEHHHASRRFLEFGEGGTGGAMSLSQVQALSTGHVRVPGVVGGGHYRDIAPQVAFAAAAAGVPEPQLLGVIRAPSPEAQRNALAALSAGRTAAQQQALRDFGATAAQTGFLTQALEPARAPGMFAAAGIGQHVAPTAASVLGPAAPFGPMTHARAASSAMEEQRQRRAAGLGEMPGVQPRGLAREDLAAIDERRARVTQMFVRLRRTVARGEIEALAGSEAAAMRRVAQAFDTWIRRRTKSADPTRLASAATALEAEITAWMRSFYG